MPSGAGTLLFVIASTPSIKTELLGSKLLAVSNGVAVDISTFYDSRSGGTANKSCLETQEGLCGLPATQEGLCGLPGQSHCQ